jgi:hypothetical protein
MLARPRGGDGITHDVQRGWGLWYSAGHASSSTSQ